MGILNEILSKINYEISKMIKTKVKAPEKWELINPDKEIEKVDFYREEDGSWIIYYNKKRIDKLSSFDLKPLKEKGYEKALYDLVYHLEVRHWIFKNRKLALKAAEKLADLMGYWK